MPIDLTVTNVDPASDGLAPLLSDLQGNVLKGHGRDWACFLFIEFDDAQQAATRKWLSELANSNITSSFEQYRQARAFRSSGGVAGGEMFVNCLLTASGYLKLGVPVANIPRDAMGTFNAGMVARGKALADPDQSAWQQEFRHPCHAMVLFANDDRQRLNAAVSAAAHKLGAIATNTWIEVGSRWLNADGRDIEPFGYADGVSQPLFYRDDITRVGGHVDWDPAAALDLVLVRDPNGAHAESCGSFLVYRKLEQDVESFDRAVAKLAIDLQVSPDLAGAYAVGRFKDGTPVLVHDRAGGSGAAANDFNYSSDPRAARCPFHSHIRKTNPRGDTVTLLQPGVSQREERAHRIVRRSMNFGQPQDIGSSPVGMHFMCYQADIGLQFEFLQINWANHVNFIRQQTGVDAIIGQGNLQPAGQKWPNAWNDSTKGTTSIQFGDFTTLRGGEYFFAPSISFLRNLDRS